MKFDIKFIYKILQEASGEIMKYYKKSKTELGLSNKDDESPFTLADFNSNKVIVDGLTKYSPNIPIISEEIKNRPYIERKTWNLSWMIDPLDGTKEFLKENDEFCINIALIKDGVAIAGAIFEPVSGDCFFTEGQGAYKILGNGKRISLEQKQRHYTELKKVRVVASRSHMSDEVLSFVKELESGGKVVEFVSKGSALKICEVLEGKADVYPRLAPTMEWDTAAGHAIAIACGYDLVQYPNSDTLEYNKENLVNPHFVLE